MLIILKISNLIIELFKFRLKGFILVDFWVGDNLPPSDFCNFVISDCNYDKSITLRNWYGREEEKYFTTKFLKREL